MMKKLKQKQADRFLEHFTQLKQLPMPRQGWVKYIRNALGMTTEQLARRLKVSRRRVVTIEQAEVNHATTLKTLKHVAAAMDCELVYAIVPRSNLKQTLENQARKFVKKHLKEIDHHMALELQTVSDKRAIESQIEDLVQHYLSKSIKVIWDD